MLAKLWKVKDYQGYTMKNKSMIDYLLYINGMKIYSKNRIELESLVKMVKICSGNIVMFQLQKCPILVIKQAKI